MSLIQKSELAIFEKYTKHFQLYFIVFYAVGITGLLIPFSFPYFIKMFPVALLLSFAGLLVFHNSKFSLKTALVFLLIFLASFAIEAIGVNTGRIFGQYSYGNALGLKLFDTPLIIGLNWLLLVYLSASLFHRANIPSGLKIVLASLIMVLYDLVMEQVAGTLDMWYWKNNIIPLQNYVAWFIVALVLHVFLKFSGLKIANRLAAVLFFCQFGFFSIVWLYYIVL